MDNAASINMSSFVDAHCSKFEDLFFALTFNSLSSPVCDECFWMLHQQFINFINTVHNEKQRQSQQQCAQSDGRHFDLAECEWR